MRIEVGTVFRFYFTEASKTKRSVVVAITSDNKKYVTLLLINSELTDFAKKNPIIRTAQLPLEFGGREHYLDHDSFLSCDNLFTRDLRELEQVVRRNPGCIIGKMDAADIKEAKRLVVECGKYKYHELIRFGILEDINEDLP